jgi:ATP-dependent exoDNAse (exonuclease V) alpha subunit
MVIYLANDYDLGLRNGSFGRILYPVVSSASSAPGCVAEFEGSQYKLTACMRHIADAYPITADKSQGYQFDRVVVRVEQQVARQR